MGTGYMTGYSPRLWLSISHSSRKKRHKNSAPFMNSELRKAINFKKSLRRKYLKIKTDKNWQKFTKQKYLVTKLKRQAIKLYFAERCGGGTKSSDVWSAISPFLTNKVLQCGDNIAISENGKIQTDTSEICEKFNSFFVNIAKIIGNSAGSLSPEDHPNIRTIRANVPSVESEFEFKPVDEARISLYLDRIGQQKATGLAEFSSKIIHLADKVILKPTVNLINRMVIDKKFPDIQKQARVTPIFKKKDPFDVQNYRPVSIPPSHPNYSSAHLKNSSVNILKTFFIHIYRPIEKD